MQTTNLFKIGEPTPIDFQGMSESRLIKSVHDFYNGWVASTRELEMQRQHIKSLQLDFEDKMAMLQGCVDELSVDNRDLREQLSESRSIGKALHCRAVELSATMQACAGSDTQHSPITTQLRDQLVAAQARVLELERMLRKKMPADVDHLMAENAVLASQRAADLLKISNLSERLTLLECSSHSRELTEIVPTISSPPSKDLLSEGVAKQEREQKASDQAAKRLSFSKGTQTRDLLPKVRPSSSVVSDDQHMRAKVRWLEAALAKKESLIAELSAAPLREPSEGESAEALHAAILSERLRSELYRREQSVSEINEQLQRVTERYHSLLAETMELRNALHEARASRARLLAELKELRAVTPDRLKELLRAEEALRELQTQHDSLQKRDRLCRELEVFVAELESELSKAREIGKDHSKLREEAVSACEGLRFQNDHLSTVCQALTNRLALIEHSACPERRNACSQSDTELEETADLKWQLTMSMNDSRYLEHEVLIRDAFIRQVHTMAASAFREAVDLKSKLSVTGLLDRLTEVESPL